MSTDGETVWPFWACAEDLVCTKPSLPWDGWRPSHAPLLLCNICSCFYSILPIFFRDTGPLYGKGIKTKYLHPCLQSGAIRYPLIWACKVFTNSKCCKHSKYIAIKTSLRPCIKCLWKTRTPYYIEMCVMLAKSSPITSFHPLWLHTSSCNKH